MKKEIRKNKIAVVYGDDSPETLAARVLREEHRIYPQAIRWFVNNTSQ